MTLSKAAAESARISTKHPATLLCSCATTLEHDGQIMAAENAFRAAAQCDPSPASRLALAEFLHRREQFREADALFECVLADAIDQGDKRLRTVVSHNLAGLLRDARQSGRARGYQQESIRGELADTFELSPEDLTALAVEALHREDWDLAENLLLRSLTIENRRQSWSGIAADCGNLGALAALRGNTAVAIRFLGRAYHQHLRGKDLRGAGTDLLNLAEVFRQAQRISLAVRCTDRAVRMFQTSQAAESLIVAQQRQAELREITLLQNFDPLHN